MYKTKQLALSALFAALTAVGALLRIPVGYTVITLQFFVTALSGMLLGARWGAISQLLYVALGFLGLPIFGSGGGFTYFLQPTCGFVLGLPLAAWIIGKLVGSSNTKRRAIAACSAGLLILYIVGFSYLVLIFRLYLNSATPIGDLALIYLLPYLPLDCAKIGACTLLFSRIKQAGNSF